MNSLSTWKILGTEWLLSQWGLWARLEQGVQGYPKAANFAKLQGGSIRTPEIEDNVAIAVDRIIKMTSVFNPNYEIALVSRYFRKRTQFQLAKDLHTSRTEAVQILRQAEAWVDGYLHHQGDNFGLLVDVDMGELTEEIKNQDEFNFG